MYADLPPDDTRPDATRQDAPRPEGAVHWGTALIAAIAVLALAVPVLSVAAPWSSRSTKLASPYSFASGPKGSAIFSTAAAVPGQVGGGTVLVGNTGTKPIRSIKLTQAGASNPFGAGLELQVFDSTTRRCIYPRPRLLKPRPGRPAPKALPRCTAWASWSAGAKLRNVVVAPRRGTVWQPKERHTVHVRWRLGSTVTPGTTATFNLVWRATA